VATKAENRLNIRAILKLLSGRQRLPSNRNYEYTPLGDECTGINAHLKPDRTNKRKRFYNEEDAQMLRDGLAPDRTGEQIEALIADKPPGRTAS